MKSYITVQGDMWDRIAHEQLGDEIYTSALMNANTDYRDIYIFSAGITLQIPEIETKTTVETLPPWKKVTA